MQNVSSLYLQGYQPIPIPGPLLNSVGEPEESSCPRHPSTIDQAVFQVWAELFEKKKKKAT